MTSTLTHPELGNIIGNDGLTVSRFLGIQYATLENRLANAQLKTYSGRGEVIADKYGCVIMAPTSGRSACSKDGTHAQR